MLINHDFFQNHWQKKPLIIRQAITLSENILCKKSLFALAGDENIDTRLVMEHGKRPWEVHFGPFDDSELTDLPVSHWTILFQDMDKHVPEVARILEQFEGMPRWRIDDVMISFAVDQGSVGPHTDEYDVFLIQTHGKRRWRINADPSADRSLVPELDMKILQQFDTDQEWLLEPGDVLYLPPNVAHWGVAEGDCITWSVGFRAPSTAELFSHWAEEKLQSIPDKRYSDPDLEIQQHHGEILPDAIESLKKMLLISLSQETGDFAQWFGRYITEPKENLQPFPDEHAVDPAELVEMINKETLHRHPASSILYTLSGNDLFLFCGGHSYSLPANYLPFAILLSQEDSWNGDQLNDWLDERVVEILLDLYQMGYIGFA
jgi:50S ribosomal protein L16 3-hydroxylase